MKNSGSDASNKVKSEEFLLTPKIFKNWRGRRQNEHVEKNMEYPGMREHVGEQLIRLEFVQLRIM